MAQEIVVEFTCDLPIHKGKDVMVNGHKEVRIQLGGVAVDIDMCDDCAKRLLRATQDYLDAGRPVPKGELTRRAGRRPTGVSARTRKSPREVRAWANAHGWSLSERGRVPEEAIKAFEQASAG